MATVLDGIAQTISGLSLLVVLLIGIILGMLILHKLSHGDISVLMGRVKRLKVFTFEIELFQQLNQLESTAEKAAKEVASSVVHPLSGSVEGSSSAHGELSITTQSRTVPQSAAISINDAANLSSTETIDVAKIDSGDEIVNIILDQAITDPKVALIRLSIELERELQRLLGSMGLLGNGRPYLSVRRALEVLNKRDSLLPVSVLAAVDDFSRVRNLIIHGGDGSRGEMLRAIDSGLLVYRTLRSVPRSTHVVYHVGAEVYADAKGQETRSDVKSLILEEVSASGVIKTKQVLPTTRAHYEKGMHVAWEFNDKVRWGESWYCNPDSQQIEYGWSSALEFVGRDIDNPVGAPT